MNPSDFDRSCMARALELARQGEGFVEPNPMVGCVVAKDGQIIGEGYHQKFGGPHAEIVALEVAGSAALGATLYVTLEPCCHLGKTGPCSKAVIDAGINRTVVAHRDPSPKVNGGGISELEAAGIQCEVGVLEESAEHLLAPYLTLVAKSQPYVIGKWAMSLDGKIATRTGDSKWISNEKSRELVQQLRGRVDGILVGSGTAVKDDPRLTARPSNPDHIRRIATRIVYDSHCQLSLSSRLIHTIDEAPVLLATSEKSDPAKRQQLIAKGVEVLVLPGEEHHERLCNLLDEFGRRQMTNLLVEGGGQLLGGLADLGCIQEVHAFIAPKIIAGQDAVTPIAGLGAELIRFASVGEIVHSEMVDGNVYLRVRLGRNQNYESS